MSRKKKDLSMRITPEEMTHLEQYCEYVGRTKTDVVRELIRSLPTVTLQSEQSNIINEG